MLTVICDQKWYKVKMGMSTEILLIFSTRFKTDFLHEHCLTKWTRLHLQGVLVWFCVCSFYVSQFSMKTYSNHDPCCAVSDSKMKKKQTSCWQQHWFYATYCEKKSKLTCEVIQLSLISFNYVITCKVLKKTDQTKGKLSPPPPPSPRRHL